MATFSTGGKRDEKLILPVNSSLSVTLNQSEVSRENVSRIIALV